MLTDAELAEFRAETLKHPECIECRVISRLLDDRQRLRDAVRLISNVLGPGICSIPNCEGCRVEMQEAARIASEAVTG